MRYCDTLTQPGRAEFFAREQAVDDDAARKPVISLEQRADGVEKARLRPGVQVEQDVFGRQQFGDLAHRIEGWIVARRLATGVFGAPKTNRRTSSARRRE